MSDFTPQERFQELMNKNFVSAQEIVHPPYIRSIIVLFFLPPIGIIALIFCFMANYYADQKRYSRALEFSDVARIVSNVSIGIIVFSAIIILMILVAFALKGAL